MTVRRLFPLAALLVAAGLVVAQPSTKPDPKKDVPAAKEPPKPAPGSLEDTLDKALRNSADIKAAEAKVRNAEADLNQVRQQVLTKATALHAELNVAKRMLAVAEETLAIHRVGLEQGRSSREGFLTAQAMVEKHRGEVEKIETELKSLRGEFALRGHNPLGVKSVAFSPDGRLLGAMEVDGTVRLWDTVSGKLVDTPAAAPAPAVQTPMMDRIKKVLDQEVDMEIEGADIYSSLHGLLAKAKADIPVRVTLANQDAVSINVKGKLPVGAWIQALEDSDQNVRIVVRDYGLLVTTRDRVPEGALRVQDLWKGNYAELKKPAPK